jgi:hypothetical protein
LLDAPRTDPYVQNSAYVSCLGNLTAQRSLGHLHKFIHSRFPLQSFRVGENPVSVIAAGLPL